MDRRALLVALGGLAGCTVDSSPPTATPPTASRRSTTDQSPDPSPVVEVGRTHDGVTVEQIVVREAVVRSDGTSRDIVHEPGTQYVVVEYEPRDRVVTAPGLYADGERVDAQAVDRGSQVETPTLAVSPVSAHRASVAFGGARWRLPEATIDRLAAVPEFHLQAARVVAAAGSTGLELTVENRGGRTGRFLARVWTREVADASSIVRFDVPEGETVTTTTYPELIRRYDADRATVRSEIDARTRSLEVGYPS